jgi:cobalt transporter subunit CbtB
LDYDHERELSLMHEVVARRIAGSLLVALGLINLFFAGLLQEPLDVHNFAHDARHAFNFPCH